MHTCETELGESENHHQIVLCEVISACADVKEVPQGQTNARGQARPQRPSTWPNSQGKYEQAYSGPEAPSDNQGSLTDPSSDPTAAAIAPTLSHTERALKRAAKRAMRKAEFEAAEGRGQDHGDGASPSAAADHAAGADGAMGGRGPPEDVPGAPPALGPAGAAAARSAHAEGAGAAVPALPVGQATAAAAASVPKKAVLPPPKFEATSRLVTSLDERLQVRLTLRLCSTLACALPVQC